MKDVFHTLVRQKREQLAISANDVAAILSMSAHELDDLETHADEWRMVVPIFKIKVLINLLKIDIRVLFDPEFQTLPIPSSETPADVIKFHREALGLSCDELSDKAGFFPPFGIIVEHHPLGLELYPVQVAIFVAEALQMPSDGFVNWILRR